MRDVACCVAHGVKGVVHGVGRGVCCVLSPLWACGGCNGEVYWNEWHNDPPRCCDPCDHCGNWTGPSTANMRAPYRNGCESCKSCQ